MLKVQYKSKWYPVKGMSKCEDQMSYLLEGVNGKVYAKDIQDVKMEKIEIVQEDGSVTRLPGKEPLLKPKTSKIKKSLFTRWQSLKKKLNNESAFYSMTSSNDDEDKKDQQDPQQAQEGQQDPQQDPQQTQAQDPQQDPQQAQSGAQEENQNLEPNAEGADRGEQEAQQGVQQAEDQGKDQGTIDNGDQEEGALNDEENAKILRNQGYSDVEIAHILHNHTPSVDNEKTMQIQRHAQGLSHKDEHHRNTVDKDLAMSKIQIDHERRMKDLEYQHAKAEKELIIKQMQQEMQINLQESKRANEEIGSGKVAEEQ